GLISPEALTIVARSCLATLPVCTEIALRCPWVMVKATMPMSTTAITAIMIIFFFIALISPHAAADPRRQLKLESCLGINYSYLRLNRGTSFIKTGLCLLELGSIAEPGREPKVISLLNGCTDYSFSKQI